MWSILFYYAKMLLNPKYQAFLTCCLGVVSLQGQFRINEIDSDTPGEDTEEIVEIFRPDGTGDSLAGHALVFFDGDDASDSVYQTIDLDFQSIDPTGYFVIGGPDVNFTQVDLFFGGGPGMDSNFIRNNTSAIALYSGPTAASYLSGSLTTPVSNADLVDVVIHRVGTAEDETLAAVFGEDDQPDENENTNPVGQSIQRNPDGGSAYRIGDPTIKLTNTPLPRILMLPSPIQVDEDAGVGASTITLTREGDVSVPLDVEIAVFPFDLTKLSVPSSASFAVNESTTTFTVDTIPNTSQDGTSIFEITASEVLGGPGSEPSYQNGRTDLVVRDEESPAPTLVINELLRSGEGDLGPEFIELYNGGLSTLNLAGYQVVFNSSDPGSEFGNVQQTITIPSGSISNGGYFTIANENVSTVYPGVSPDLVLTGLDLPNDDTTVILLASGGNPVFSALLQDGELDAVPNFNGVPLAADLLVGQDEGDNPAGYFLTADGGQIGQILASVESNVEIEEATPDAANAIAPTLFLSRNSELIDEDDSGTITFTVTRVPDLTGDLEVTIFSDDTTELTTPTTVTILDGESTVSFSGNPETDGVRDGIQAVNVTVSATAHRSGTSEVAVLDSDIPDLVACDIAFIASISAGEEDVFAFVTLTEIFSGARITLTDRGWKASGGFLDAGEGEMDWLAVEDVPAGTVVTFVNNQPDVGTASSGGPDLSDSGDQIFAYQGSSSNPTLIAGIQMNGAWDADATDVFTSALPAALASAGAVAIDPERNNAVYTGSTSDALSVLKAALFSPASFTSGNNSSSVGANLIPESFEITAAVPYEVSVSDFSLSGNTAVIDFTATGLSDVYISTNLESWTLATGGEDVESGQFIDPNRPAGKAFYLVQEADAEAP